jgi:hypothetical protein
VDVVGAAAVAAVVPAVCPGAPAAGARQTSCYPIVPVAFVDGRRDGGKFLPIDVLPATLLALIHGQQCAKVRQVR